MKHLFLAAMLLAIPAFADPALAETPMSAQAFDSYATGKTLYYGSDGQSYGAEEYLDDRRVRWSFLDGKCKDGYWYEAKGQICFVYEDNPDPQCWSFYEKPGGLTARFENDINDTELYEVEQNSKPMLCLGPDVGV